MRSSRRRTVRSLDEICRRWSEVGVTREDLERSLAQGGPRHMQERVRCDAVYDHLRATFTTPGAAQVWLRSPNRVLEGATPLEAIRNSEFDRVEAALVALDSGIFL